MASLMESLSAAQTIPFGAALIMMVGIGVIEGLGLLVIGSPSAALEEMLSIDHGVDGGLGGLLGWLHVGKVPLLVLLVLYLMGFAIGGYAIQMIAHAMFGLFLPAFLACVPAFFLGLANVRVTGGLLGRVIPREETTAVSEMSLIGRTGFVVTGTARAGLAAEVKVMDQHGNPHYLMVEPDNAGDEYPEGTEVLIVSKTSSQFRAIRSPYPVTTN